MELWRGMVLRWHGAALAGHLQHEDVIATVARRHAASLGDAVQRANVLQGARLATPHGHQVHVPVVATAADNDVGLRRGGGGGRGGWWW